MSYSITFCTVYVPTFQKLRDLLPEGMRADLSERLQQWVVSAGPAAGKLLYAI